MPWEPKVRPITAAMTSSGMVIIRSVARMMTVSVLPLK